MQIVKFEKSRPLRVPIGWGFLNDGAVINTGDLILKKRSWLPVSKEIGLHADKERIVVRQFAKAQSGVVCFSDHAEKSCGG